jgi:hypothetical protein
MKLLTISFLHLDEITATSLVERRLAVKNSSG